MTTLQIHTEANIAQPEIALNQSETLQAENEKLKATIKDLTEQLNWFKRQIFGARSEKIITSDPDNVLYLPGVNWDNEKTEIEEKPVVAHKRKKQIRDGKDKISFPDDLPIEKIVIDIPEEQKVCPETGVALVKIGEEVTQKLAHKPGSFFIKQVIRPKYAVPKNPDAGIQIALLPETLLDRCLADESFLADILVKKYADHLPLYRQCEILSRQNIQISRQTLCNWVIRAGTALKPLKDAMKKRILESENVFIDETPIRLLESSNGESKQGFMWVLAGGLERDPPYRIYEFYENRKHCNAEELLKDFKGRLHSDKYGGYEELAKLGLFEWCPCWAHIRRKFFEAESGDADFRAYMLANINQLFTLEKAAWDLNSEERLQIRKEKEVPIINELIKAVTERLVTGTLLPKSKFKEALGYFTGLIPYLMNYTKYPYARLDNNVSERCIRPLAVGRKNWLFFATEGGGEAASIIFSLVQTCRALKINPWEYLDDVMRRLQNHPISKIHELLPDYWASART